MKEQKKKEYFGKQVQPFSKTDMFNDSYIFENDHSRMVKSIRKTISRAINRKLGVAFKRRIWDEGQTSHPYFQEYIGEAIFRIWLDEPDIIVN